MMATLEELNARLKGFWPDVLGMHFTEIGDKRLHARVDVRHELLAPNGYLHAGAIVTLADTVCGIGCIINLPSTASGFTTIELKSNFLGTALGGTITCEGSLVHGGRSTQVWDAVVVNEQTGQKIAVFRATQMVLYPRA